MIKKELIKEYGSCFSKDLNDTIIIQVIGYITNSDTITDTDKRYLIQQFLLNWIDIDSIAQNIAFTKHCI